MPIGLHVGDVAEHSDRILHTSSMSAEQPIQSNRAGLWLQLDVRTSGEPSAGVGVFADTVQDGAPVAAPCQLSAIDACAPAPVALDATTP